MGASFSGIFEWREAARFALVAWERFQEIDGDEQSAIVAHYRVHNQLEAVISQHQNRERGRGRRKPGR